MAAMRLSVDAFTGLFSTAFRTRKAKIGTSVVAAAALTAAVGAFAWNANASRPAVVAEPALRPARVAEIKYLPHMHSLWSSRSTFVPGSRPSWAASRAKSPPARSMSALSSRRAN
jgi:hypothetical protein